MSLRLSSAHLGSHAPPPYVSENDRPRANGTTSSYAGVSRSGGGESDSPQRGGYKYPRQIRLRDLLSTFVVFCLTTCFIAYVAVDLKRRYQGVLDPAQMARAMQRWEHELDVHEKQHAQWAVERQQHEDFLGRWEEERRNYSAEVDGWTRERRLWIDEKAAHEQELRHREEKEENEHQDALRRRQAKEENEHQDDLRRRRQERNTEQAEHTRQRKEWAKEMSKHAEVERQWEVERMKKMQLHWKALRRNPHCSSYGTREYTSRLSNLILACQRTTRIIKGRELEPDECEDRGDDGVHGHWMIDFDELACQPYWGDMHDKGCVGEGTGLHRMEARLLNIQSGDDWQRMCDTTPNVIRGQKFKTPTACEHRGIFNGMVGIWDVHDSQC